MRGPGDFFSSNNDNILRQSGGFEFKFASKCDSTDLLENAFNAAKTIVSSDPTLSLPDHILLRQEIEKRIQINTINIS